MRAGLRRVPEWRTCCPTMTSTPWPTATARRSCKPVARTIRSSCCPTSSPSGALFAAAGAEHRSETACTWRSVRWTDSRPLRFQPSKKQAAGWVATSSARRSSLSAAPDELALRVGRRGGPWWNAVTVRPRLKDLALRSDGTWRRRRPVEVPNQQAEHCSQQKSQDRESARPRLDPASDGLPVGSKEEHVGND